MPGLQPRCNYGMEKETGGPRQVWESTRSKFDEAFRTFVGIRPTSKGNFTHYHGKVLRLAQGPDYYPDIMSKIRFIFLASVFIFVLIFNSCALCAETYYIDNNRVLLYKVINWWYDCLPGESENLCDRLVKYERRGDIIVEYNNYKMNLALKAEGGFAAQLSVPDLKCIWSDKTVFGDGTPVDITAGQLSIGEVTINNIDVTHYQRLQDIIQDLAVELEGRIAGLLNGQIALHRTGPFIKACPVSLKNTKKNSAASFRIINFHTKEVVAVYSTVF